MLAVLPGLQSELPGLWPWLGLPTHREATQTSRCSLGSGHVTQHSAPRSPAQPCGILCTEPTISQPALLCFPSTACAGCSSPCSYRAPTAGLARPQPRAGRHSEPSAGAKGDNCPLRARARLSSQSHHRGPGSLYLFQRSSSSPPQPQKALGNPLIFWNCSTVRPLTPPKNSLYGSLGEREGSGQSPPALLPAMGKPKP